jgi:hypothetical protein
LHRRLRNAGRPETDEELAAQERRLIDRARAAGYDNVAARTLSDVELVALMQHEGAATRFLDVAPDPFIALFFACEHATASDNSAALIALLVQDDWPIRPQPVRPRPERMTTVVDPSCIGRLDYQRIALGGKPSSAYLVQTAFLNERMKAQRGQFVVGRLPADPKVAEWSSLPIELLQPSDEQNRITKLLAATPGRPPAKGERPRVIVFRISPTIRKALRRQLAERFGYTTETIYPDLNGFARAFDQYAPLS